GLLAVFLDDVLFVFEASRCRLEDPVPLAFYLLVAVLVGAVAAMVGNDELVAIFPAAEPGFAADGVHDLAADFPGYFLEFPKPALKFVRVVALSEIGARAADAGPWAGGRCSSGSVPAGTR